MPLPPKKPWSELSPRQRAATLTAVAVQLSLLTAALTDLRRRPASEVRGPKRAWVLASFVNFVGPLAYFAFGRRR
ncbi:MAG: PLDc_N domain-containing protein [Solirubrobacteraceae bacterium]|nr:PLDc_N domain-containing protein [Solirubrobacteraceae bacterium]